MADRRYDAVIIGAGHNGLVTAGYLARSGLSVLMLERLDKIGGAMTTDEFAPGFWGPMCAYVLHGFQGKVIDDLKLRQHGFEVARRADSYGRFHPFPDGSFFGGPGALTDLDIAGQIRARSEHDARSYLAWVAFWEQAGAILRPYFLTEPPSVADLVESVRGTAREEVLEKLLTWSFLELLDEYFDDEHVRAFVLRTPECDARGAGSMLGTAIRQAEASREEDKGVPRGSMGAVIDAIASAVRSLGVEIRTGAPVQQVLVKDGTAVGVRLASGEEVGARVVVSNADPKRTFTTLLDRADLAPETLRRVGRWRTQAGSLKFLAALRELPDLSRYLGSGYDPKAVVAMRVMPSVEYHLQSWDDCAAGRPSSCPIMSIQMTTVADPSLAPHGGHVMSNWVLYENPVLRDGTWADKRTEVGERIIDTLTEYFPNFRRSVVDWTVQTPEDIETRVGLTGGNIRHLDEIPSQLLRNRQSYRTEIKNFYMCGAGTHPEGEVIAANGHNAAHAILKDLGRRTLPSGATRAS